MNKKFKLDLIFNVILPNIALISGLMALFISSCIQHPVNLLLICIGFGELLAITIVYLLILIGAVFKFKALKSNKVVVSKAEGNLK